MYIIAEIGINHNGSMDHAKKLIRQAYDSKCHAVKFQKRDPDVCVPENQKSVVRETPWGTMTYLEYKWKIEFNAEQYNELRDYTKNLGMDFIVSCWDKESIKVIEDNVDVDYHKVASALVTDKEFLKDLVDTGKPIILSTGMQNLLSVEKPVEILEKKNIEYALLECTNIYPCPPEDIALGSLAQLSDKFPNAEIGFSDHSIGPTMALAAVALGATIVEKHFTDTKNRPGPDISCSMDPDELEHLIKKSKEVAYSRDRKKFIANVEKDVYKLSLIHI